MPRFVVHEHHARSLHWDLRLERDGVLASWAVPKGLPPEPGIQRLAIAVADHDLEHLTYTDARKTIWASGTYVEQPSGPTSIDVTLDGGPATGRFLLIHTGGSSWLLRRRS